jgi:thiol-disulfide isomerase/thioredoxin
MEATDIYKTDIEMVMDFMKLSMGFDNENISDKERYDIIKLQKAILELLPVAQSNRMSTVYGILADIYQKNKKEYTDRLSSHPDKHVMITTKQKENRVIVLFYRPTCPACKKIMGHWKEFKRQHKDSNFTITEYNSENPDNREIFESFEIEFVPTIFKLAFDEKDNKRIKTKMNDKIDPDSLHRFAKF